MQFFLKTGVIKEDVLIRVKFYPPEAWCIDSSAEEAFIKNTQLTAYFSKKTPTRSQTNTQKHTALT